MIVLRTTGTPVGVISSRPSLKTVSYSPLQRITSLRVLKPFSQLQGLHYVCSVIFIQPVPSFAMYQPSFPSRESFYLLHCYTNRRSIVCYKHTEMKANELIFTIYRRQTFPASHPYLAPATICTTVDSDPSLKASGT